MRTILTSTSYHRYVEVVKNGLKEKKIEVLQLLKQGTASNLSIVAGNCTTASNTNSSTGTTSGTICFTGCNTACSTACTSASFSGSSQKPLPADS